MTLAHASHSLSLSFCIMELCIQQGPGVTATTVIIAVAAAYLTLFLCWPGDTRTQGSCGFQVRSAMWLAGSPQGGVGMGPWEEAPTHLVLCDAEFRVSWPAGKAPVPPTATPTHWGLYGLSNFTVPSFFSKIHLFYERQS